MARGIVFCVRRMVLRDRIGRNHIWRVGVTMIESTGAGVVGIRGAHEVLHVDVVLLNVLSHVHLLDRLRLATEVKQGEETETQGDRDNPSEENEPISRLVVTSPRSLITGIWERTWVHLKPASRAFPAVLCLSVAGVTR